MFTLVENDGSRVLLCSATFYYDLACKNETIWNFCFSCPIRVAIFELIPMYSHLYLWRITSKTHQFFQHDLQTRRILPNHLTLVKDRGTLHCPRPWVSFEIWKSQLHKKHLVDPCCTFIFLCPSLALSRPLFSIASTNCYFARAEPDWLAAHPL